jgi:peptidoglycan/xylan/chitin deacetylase (PgdA/CDA1 family)
MQAKAMNLKRLVFITGDVHHPPDLIKRLYYKEIATRSDYELRAALEYAKIVSELNASCTLFVTGKALDMFPSIVKKIASLNAEIGGHTYYAFRGPFYGYTLLIPLYTKIFGTPYGPKLLIRHDVYRTIHALRRVRVDARAWRTHGYHGNEYLYRLLAKLGFKIVSDCISNEFRIFKEHGLTHVCINMPVDDGLSRLSSNNRIEWYRNYIRVLKQKVMRGEPLVLQLHPVNMALDNFEFLLDVIKILSKEGYMFLNLSKIVGVSP